MRDHIPDIVILAGFLASALWAVFSPRLLRAVIGLATASICVTMALFRLGAPLAAVFELSVCAGLISAVFISTISLAAIETDEIVWTARKERLRRYWYLPLLLVLAGVVLTQIALPPVPEVQVMGADVREVLWTERAQFRESRFVSTIDTLACHLDLGVWLPNGSKSSHVLSKGIMTLTVHRKMSFAHKLLAQCLTTGIFVSMFLFSGCVKEPLAPVMPLWDVNLTVPLLNRSYTIGKIIEKDTTLLRVGYGNVLSVATSSQVRPTYVGSSLSISMQPMNASMKLGLFGITMPPIVSPIMIPGLPQGATIPIPETTVSVPVVYDTISTFESVSLVEGIMTLTFRNNLPVPVDVVGPVYMIDDANSVIATFEYNPTTIQPNASRSVQDNLANKTIGSPQTVGNIISIYGLTLHVHGSATPVLIPFGDMMVATISTSGLKARRAVNVILPSQRLVNTDSIQVRLGDSTMIQEARIKSGSLNIAMHNTLDLDVMFKFQFKELLRPSAGGYVMYDDSVFIPRLGSVTRSLDGAGYRILSSNGNLLSSLEAFSTVIIPISSTQPITVNDTDKVSVTLTNPVPFVIDSAIAVVKPTYVNVNTVVALGLKGLPQGLTANLNIPSASLGLTTQSGIGFPLDLNIRFAARKQSGDSVFLDVPASERRVQPGTGLIQFDGAAVGQFLSQLFSGSLPDSIRVSGKALVNPPDVYNPTPSGVGHIGSNSGLSGKVDLQIPLTMGISNGMYSDTVAFGDTSGTGHGTFTGKDRLNSVNSGKMFIEVENRTPVKVDFALRLLNRGNQSLLTLPRSGQSVVVNAAQVDADGNVVSATKSTIVIELSGADVQQFIPAEFMSYSLSFVSTPGAPVVKIKTTDGVKVRIWSNLSYRVN